MATRTDRLQVFFEVGGDGKLKATLLDMGKDGEKAAQGLDKASASHDRLISAAKTAGTVLGTSIVAGLALVIKNTMEAERVDAQLEARLKSTAGVAGMTKEALDDLATATARKTTFDDEAVKSAEAMLLTFTKVYADVFPRAIDAITDMATAMGTDLETATVQVGKALNDPIQGVSALTRVGVQFSDGQKKVIKDLVETGRTAEAQAVILKELETQFGGAAEAARGTFGGALQALKNSLDDLTEGEGGSLDGATEAVNKLTDTLNDPDVKAGFAAIISGVASVTAEIANGIGIMANYLQQYRNIANLGDGSMKRGDATDQALQQRLAAISATKSRLNKGGALGTLTAMYAPDSALTGADFFKTRDQVMEDLNKERTAIIREMTQRNKAALATAGVDAAFAFITEPSGKGHAPPTPDPPNSPKPTSPRRTSAAKRDMPDFYGDTVQDIQREIAAAAQLDEEWKQLAATLGGPLAEAEYKHQQNLKEIEELGRKTGQSAEDIQKLKDQETAAYEKQRQAIEASLDPLGQLLQSYQQEIDLMGMGNAERAMANELRRQGIDLASGEARAYMESARSVDETARAHADALGYVDDMKGVAKDLLMDMSKDAAGTFKNIGDYWETLVDRMLSRWLDAGLDGLFSGQGFSGFSGGFGGGSGGNSGGGFWGMLGSLFSSGSSSGVTAFSQNGVSGAEFASIFSEGGAFGFANGGVMTNQGPIPLRAYASGGVARTPQMALYGEGSRPEAFVPLPDGRSIPVTLAGGGGGRAGDTYHMPVTISVRGDDRARTADQVAERLDRRTQRARRNR